MTGERAFIYTTRTNIEIRPLLYDAVEWKIHGGLAGGCLSEGCSPTSLQQQED
jgi:hypothetical protein